MIRLKRICTANFYTINCNIIISACRQWENCENIFFEYFNETIKSYSISFFSKSRRNITQCIWKWPRNLSFVHSKILVFYDNISRISRVQNNNIPVEQAIFHLKYCSFSLHAKIFSITDRWYLLISFPPDDSRSGPCI